MSWQDTYQSAISDAEAGLTTAWAERGDAPEVLAKIGAKLISGDPAKLGQARDVVLGCIQAWAARQADQVTTIGEIYHEAL
jgi:hypothetical protein